MKNKIIGYQGLFFLFFVLPRVHGQDVEAGIRQAFANHRSSYVQEKLYVHTDRNFYVPGEILWFRIYDVDAVAHRPLHISKLAYVELLDASNRSVLREKISLKPGEARGSLLIPAGIASGNYRFLAYTRWMKNFSPDYFFEKNIQIANPEKMSTDSLPAVADRYDIQFFPEGGNLVEQLESTVGFRITDAWGRGQEAEGLLVDDRGDTVLRFHPLALGLGHFIFTPATGRRYTAQIRVAGGKSLSRPLPAALPAGCVMRVRPEGAERLSVAVVSAARSAGERIYLLVQTRGALKKLSSQRLENGKTQFSVGTAELGDGISQFTIFDGTGKPVCERVYFKYPVKTLNISAETTQPEFERRREIRLNLAAADADGRPAPADMSLAVYQLDTLQPVDETDISQYLYLEADLGPGIESPEYYFRDGGAGRGEAMDNLMLTRGWRRFTWNSVLSNQKPDIEYAPEWNGHILEGTLVSGRTGAGLADVDTYLSVPSLRTQFRTTRSDSAGRLRFELDNFYGSQEIILQTDPREDSSGRFEIDNPFAHRSLPAWGAALPLPALPADALTDRSVQAQVQRVYGGIRLAQFIPQLKDSSTFYVTPDEKYLLDDYTRFQTMEEVLREYVQSVNVLHRHDKFELYVFNPAYRNFFSGRPLILLDGVPIFDADKLFHLDPMKIRRLDLVTQRYFMGYKGFDGVVNVTTYRGDLDGFEMDPRATVLDYPGIPEERQFFSPEYETEEQVSSRVPDFRTLLKWVPQIKTGATGKESVRFFSSDLPGRYAVVVQGITAGGESGSRIIYFTVKK